MKERPIILASNSPRRKELLARLIPKQNFKIIGSTIKERHKKGEKADSFSLRIAEAKAMDVIKKYRKMIDERAIIIAADTVISFQGEIIGQPKDQEDARRILRNLAGKKHEVITGVVLILINTMRRVKFTVHSQVWMKALNEREIQDYIASGESMDKTGAYAIQGKGKKFLERYEGSLTNIIGLPVEELRANLTALI